MTKPWDNEPTPTTDSKDHRNGIIAYQYARNLERRLRHAERLLEKSWKTRELEDMDQLHNDVLDHLEVARLEDGQ